jgi:TIR domain
VRGSVFINYRYADGGCWAALLYRDMVHLLGPDLVFMDSLSIPAGADFTVELLARARCSQVVFAVIGPRWLSAVDAFGRRLIDDPQDWVRRELAAAFDAGVRVIPVLVDDARLPTEGELPPELGQLGRCQYRLLRIRDVMVDLDRLRKDLQSAEPSRPRRSGLPRLGVA